MKEDILISFVIPVKDERETVAMLLESISAVLFELGHHNFEIIIIDDGSTDGTWPVIEDLANAYKGKVIGIRFRKNFGKSAALEAGFHASTGDIIFTLDADLQDDPKEIPRFLQMIADGYDMVSGWKVKRYDPFSKTLPSKVFNRATSWISGVTLHDFNCGFKCYTRDVIDNISLYGELHRFIPVLVNDLGFRVGELEVEHHPRRYGVSKFGWERYLRGAVDLITVQATTRWLNKPGHLFGGIGVIFGLLGGAQLLYLIALWFLGYRPIGLRPLLLFGVMFCIFSLQMFSLGIIAEFFLKTNNSISVNKYVAEQTTQDKATLSISDKVKCIIHKHESSAVDI
jgi:glycosyltransferase involved in cell wall biosynthesis